MSMQVLQTRSQVTTARKELIARNVSRLESPLLAAIKRSVRHFGIPVAPTVGDELKSWDVLKTLQFLETRIVKGDPVVDIGSYASEIIVALHLSGFTDLTGVDLNPHLQSMPHSDIINYVAANFMDTGLPSGKFAAITSISVIEHGYEPQRLMAEVSRLLRPGGVFVASFDYWPNKIDARGKRFFDMDWLIFSADDVAALVAEAARHGLRPVGPMETGATDRAIEHGGFHYTFGWIALEKGD
jgi:SAM-dependent methyltransferase